MNNIISRRTHGVLDYVVGIVLILAPRIFGFDTGGRESRIPIILGIAALVYSLLTNYELGVFKVLPFRLHLTLDTLSGLFLALSPWLFSFADQVWVPHLVLGLIELGAVFMTRTVASEQHTGAPGSPAHT
jgi:hypothetical protein